MKILSIFTFIIIFSLNNSYAQNFELDRGIGFSKGRDVEDWVKTQDFQNSPTNINSSFNRINSIQRSNLASSQGNSIVVQTQPGSHVVVNASQINSGNQTAEVNLKSISRPKYNNVEIPTYNTENNLYHSQ
jgi:formylmethanofuran dehydrogenase subunit D